MAAFRRTRWVAFSHEDVVAVDLGALLEGALDVKRTSGIVASSALTGEETALSPEELEVLAALSTDGWTPAQDLGASADIAYRLAERGLLTCDADDEPLRSLRERDERLETEQWNRYAAQFHFVQRRREGTSITLDDAQRFEPEIASTLEAIVAAQGPPPPAFHTRNVERSYSLELDDAEGELYDALRARRTARRFDDAPVSLRNLSTLLRYTFGCHGYWRYTEALIALRKTAPSGGGLHPIEAYPLALNVEGIPVGAYHYNVERHALDLLAPMDPADARTRVGEAACGQQFFAAAGVVIVLAARFFRSFWKYRDDPRAYSVLLMDVGHVAQTFHLVGANIGLGTFITAAVDAPSAEALIDVDGLSEGAIAFLGCGHPSGERSVLDRDPIPYSPKTLA